MGERTPITGSDVANHMASEAKREALKAQQRATNARLEIDPFANEPPAIKHEPRCPTCGLWQSTRYASWPHLCVVPSEKLREIKENLDRDLMRGELKRLEAGMPTTPPMFTDTAAGNIWFDRPGRAYPMPAEPEPAGPSTVFLAYCAGALSGCFITVLISMLF